MDKRWIMILIIIIIAGICGYFIASSSDTVGNAIVDVNTFTVTVPHNFGIDSTVDETIFIKRGSNEKVLLKDLGKQDSGLKEYNKKIKSFSKNDDIKILNNTTTTNGNCKIYMINYESSSQKNMSNQSMAYLYTYEHTFSVKLTGFSDTDYMNDVLNFIAQTLKPDYKKSQE